MKINRKNVAALLAVVFATAWTMESKSQAGKTVATPQSVYACTGCRSICLEAGPCPQCNRELIELTLLGTKNGHALVCDSVGCMYNIKDMKHGKCACGKTVVVLGCKGLYACPNGLPELSANPGRCACGKTMKRI